jgi:hypothetical protein
LLLAYATPSKIFDVNAAVMEHLNLLSSAISYNHFDIVYFVQ